MLVTKDKRAARIIEAKKEYDFHRSINISEDKMQKGEIPKDRLKRLLLRNHATNAYESLHSLHSLSLLARIPAISMVAKRGEIVPWIKYSRERATRRPQRLLLSDL